MAGGYKIDTTTVQPIVIPEATETSDGVMSSEDKTKLDSLSPSDPGINVDIYVDSIAGNDANPGTITQPVQSIQAAELLKSIGWREHVHINLADGYYTLPAGSVFFSSGGPEGLGLGTPGTGPTPEVWIGALRSQAAVQTRLTAAIPNAVSTAAIAVTTTENFAASGTLEIANEVIGYTGVTATTAGTSVIGATFTGITRGVSGTPSAHPAGANVNWTVTTLTSPMTTGATTANVVNTTNFSASGVLLLDSEFVTYSGKTPTSFTGLVRGAKGTVAATHATGTSLSFAKTVGAGGNGFNIVDSTAVFRSGASASITAVSGAGQARVMTVTGMSGLVASDVGRNFLFSLATSKSTGNAGTTSVTFGTPVAATGVQTITGLTGATFSTTGQVGDLISISGAANASNNGIFRIITTPSATSVTIANSAGVSEGPTASVVWSEQGVQSKDSGNNGHFRMASFISATSATFSNAQALVENTGAIYWQDSYRGSTVNMLSGAASPFIPGAISDHGIQATGTLTVVPKASLVDNDNFTMNDGTNPAVTFEYKVTGGFAPVVGRVTIDISTIADTSAAGVAVQTAQTINANPPNAGANPLRVRAAANNVNLSGGTQTSVIQVTLMLANGAGVAITEAVANAAFLVSGFTGGLGTPTTTYTFLAAFSPVPSVGDAYAVIKPGAILQSSGTVNLYNSASPLGLVGIKFQGTSTSFVLIFDNLSAGLKQVEIDGVGGNWTCQGGTPSAVEASIRDTPLWAADSNSPFQTGAANGGKHIIYAHNVAGRFGAEAFLCNTMTIDSAQFTILGKSTLIPDSRRTTYFIGQPNGFVGGTAAAMFNGNNWAVLSNFAPTDPAGIIIDLESTILLSTGTVSNCYGYGVLAKNNSSFVAADFHGSGHSQAAMCADRSSHGTIDANALTTNATGQAGDFEFGHEATPNIQTYAVVRATNTTPGVFRTAANVTGHNGAGACTATGLKVGDKPFSIGFAKVPTAGAGSQGGLTGFESTITVANQIQQTSAANFSSDSFDVIVQAVNTTKGFADGYGNRVDVG